MNTARTRMGALLWLLLVLVASPRSLLGQECCCPPAPCACSCQACCCPPTTCTVVTPQWSTEYRTKLEVRYRPETRQRMVAVYHDVPSTRTIEEEYTVMVSETRTRTVAETIKHPVYGDVRLRTTTMTPQVESRQGTYTVNRLVPVQEERTACECSDCCTPRTFASPPAPPAPGGPDPNAPPAPPARPYPPAVPGAGHPADASLAGGACNAGCNACALRKVCVTCWKPVSEQVAVQFPVTRFEPSSRLDIVPFYEYQTETKFPRGTVRGPDAANENANAERHRDAVGRRTTTGTIHGDGPLRGARAGPGGHLPLCRADGDRSIALFFSSCCLRAAGLSLAGCSRPFSDGGERNPRRLPQTAQTMPPLPRRISLATPLTRQG